MRLPHLDLPLILMNLFHALFLGIIQGATEFLPVSSSGHLVLAQYFLGIRQPNLFFEVLLHIGTLIAVLIFYRHEIIEVICDSLTAIRLALRGQAYDALELEGVRIALFVLIASIPTAILGLAFNDLLDPANGSSIISPRVVSITLILNGFMLYAYRWLHQSDHDDSPIKSTRSIVSLWGITPPSAFLIGIAQGIAVMPGISRSGSTITAGLLLGTHRIEAARFSFLISIPAIVGAFILKLRELNPETISPTDWFSFGIGALTASVVGFLCLKWLVALLRATKFYTFAYYCWILGLLSLLLTFFYPAN